MQLIIFGYTRVQIVINLIIQYRKQKIAKIKTPGMQKAKQLRKKIRSQQSPELVKNKKHFSQQAQSRDQSMNKQIVKFKVKERRQPDGNHRRYIVVLQERVKLDAFLLQQSRIVYKQPMSNYQKFHSYILQEINKTLKGLYNNIKASYEDKGQLQKYQRFQQLLNKFMTVEIYQQGYKQKYKQKYQLKSKKDPELDQAQSLQSNWVNIMEVNQKIFNNYFDDGGSSKPEEALVRDVFDLEGLETGQAALVEQWRTKMLQCRFQTQVISKKLHQKFQALPQQNYTIDLALLYAQPIMYLFKQPLSTQNKYQQIQQKQVSYLKEVNRIEAVLQDTSICRSSSIEVHVAHLGKIESLLEKGVKIISFSCHGGYKDKKLLDANILALQNIKEYSAEEAHKQHNKKMYNVLQIQSTHLSLPGLAYYLIIPILIQKLKKCKNLPQVIVFNSCSSNEFAETIHNYFYKEEKKHIITLGYMKPMNNKICQKIAQELYLSLFSGNSIKATLDNPRFPHHPDLRIYYQPSHKDKIIIQPILKIREENKLAEIRKRTQISLDDYQLDRKFLFDFMRQLLDKCDYRTVVNLYGNPGSGKSFICRKAVNYLWEREMIHNFFIINCREQSQLDWQPSASQQATVPYQITNILQFRIALCCQLPRLPPATKKSIICIDNCQPLVSYQTRQFANIIAYKHKRLIPNRLVIISDQKLHDNVFKVDLNSVQLKPKNIEFHKEWRRIKLEKAELERVQSEKAEHHNKNDLQMAEVEDWNNFRFQDQWTHYRNEKKTKNKQCLDMLNLLGNYMFAQNSPPQQFATLCIKYVREHSKKIQPQQVHKLFLINIFPSQLYLYPQSEQHSQLQQRKQKQGDLSPSQIRDIKQQLQTYCPKILGQLEEFFKESVAKCNREEFQGEEYDEFVDQLGSNVRMMYYIAGFYFIRFLQISSCEYRDNQSKYQPYIRRTIHRLLNLCVIAQKHLQSHPPPIHQTFRILELKLYMFIYALHQNSTYQSGPQVMETINDCLYRLSEPLEVMSVRNIVRVLDEGAHMLTEVMGTGDNAPKSKYSQSSKQKQIYISNILQIKSRLKPPSQAQKFPTYPLFQQKQLYLLLLAVLRPIIQSIRQETDRVIFGNHDMIISIEECLQSFGIGRAGGYLGNWDMKRGKIMGLLRQVERMFMGMYLELIIQIQKVKYRYPKTHKMWYLHLPRPPHAHPHPSLHKHISITNTNTLLTLSKQTYPTLVPALQQQKARLHTLFPILLHSSCHSFQDNLLRVLRNLYLQLEKEIFFEVESIGMLGEIQGVGARYRDMDVRVVLGFLGVDVELGTDQKEKYYMLEKYQYEKIQIDKLVMKRNILNTQTQPSPTISHKTQHKPIENLLQNIPKSTLTIICGNRVLQLDRKIAKNDAQTKFKSKSKSKDKDEEKDKQIGNIPPPFACCIYIDTFLNSEADLQQQIDEVIDKNTKQWERDSIRGLDLCIQRLIDECLKKRNHNTNQKNQLRTKLRCYLIKKYLILRKKILKKYIFQYFYPSFCKNMFMHSSSKNQNRSSFPQFSKSSSPKNLLAQITSAFQSAKLFTKLSCLKKFGKHRNLGSDLVQIFQNNIFLKIYKYQQLQSTEPIELEDSNGGEVREFLTGCLKVGVTGHQSEKGGEEEFEGNRGNFENLDYRRRESKGRIASTVSKFSDSEFDIDKIVEQFGSDFGYESQIQQLLKSVFLYIAQKQKFSNQLQTQQILGAIFVYALQLQKQQGNNLDSHINTIESQTIPLQLPVQLPLQRNPSNSSQTSNAQIASPNQSELVAPTSPLPSPDPFTLPQPKTHSPTKCLMLVCKNRQQRHIVNTFFIRLERLIPGFLGVVQEWNRVEQDKRRGQGRGADGGEWRLEGLDGVQEVQEIQITNQNPSNTNIIIEAAKNNAQINSNDITNHYYNLNKIMWILPLNRKYKGPKQASKDLQWGKSPSLHQAAIKESAQNSQLQQQIQEIQQYLYKRLGSSINPNTKKPAQSNEQPKQFIENPILWAVYTGYTPFKEYIGFNCEYTNHSLFKMLKHMYQHEHGGDLGKIVVKVIDLEAFASQVRNSQIEQKKEEQQKRDLKYSRTKSYGPQPTIPNHLKSLNSQPSHPLPNHPAQLPVPTPNLIIYNIQTIEQKLQAHYHNKLRRIIIFVNDTVGIPTGGNEKGEKQDSGVQQIVVNADGTDSVREFMRLVGGLIVRDEVAEDYPMGDINGHPKKQYYSQKKSQTQSNKKDKNSSKHINQKEQYKQKFQFDHQTKKRKTKQKKLAKNRDKKIKQSNNIKNNNNNSPDSQKNKANNPKLTPSHNQIHNDNIDNVNTSPNTKSLILNPEPSMPLKKAYTYAYRYGLNGERQCKALLLQRMEIETDRGKQEQKQEELKENELEQQRKLQKDKEIKRKGKNLNHQFSNNQKEQKKVCQSKIVQQQQRSQQQQQEINQGKLSTKHQPKRQRRNFLTVKNLDEQDNQKNKGRDRNIMKSKSRSNSKSRNKSRNKNRNENYLEEQSQNTFVKKQKKKIEKKQQKNKNKNLSNQKQQSLKNINDNQQNGAKRQKNNNNVKKVQQQADNTTLNSILTEEYQAYLQKTPLIHTQYCPLLLLEQKKPKPRIGYKFTINSQSVLEQYTEKELEQGQEQEQDQDQELQLESKSDEEQKQKQGELKQEEGKYEVNGLLGSGEVNQELFQWALEAISRQVLKGALKVESTKADHLRHQKTTQYNQEQLQQIIDQFQAYNPCNYKSPSTTHAHAQPKPTGLSLRSFLSSNSMESPTHTHARSLQSQNNINSNSNLNVNKNKNAHSNSNQSSHSQSRTKINQQLHSYLHTEGQQYIRLLRRQCMQQAVKDAIKQVGNWKRSRGVGIG